MSNNQQMPFFNEAMGAMGAMAQMAMQYEAQNPGASQQYMQQQQQQQGYQQGYQQQPPQPVAPNQQQPIVQRGEQIQKEMAIVKQNNGSVKFATSLDSKKAVKIILEPLGRFTVWDAWDNNSLYDVFHTNVGLRFGQTQKEGKYPTQAQDCKLFISSPDILGGAYIQFSGPGAEIDGRVAQFYDFLDYTRRAAPLNAVDESDLKRGQYKYHYIIYFKWE